MTTRNGGDLIRGEHRNHYSGSMINYHQQLRTDPKILHLEERNLCKTRISPNTSQSGSPGSFFGLPLEIRDSIYQFYSFNKRLIWSFRSREDHDDSHGNPEKKYLRGAKSLPTEGRSANALFHVSRQTYIEGSYLFYQNNGFSLYNGFTLYKFIQEVRLTHIRSIRELHIARLFNLGIRSRPSTLTDFDFDSLKLVQWFTNLETLHIGGINASSQLHELSIVYDDSQRAHRIILMALYKLIWKMKGSAKITLVSDIPQSRTATFTNPFISSLTLDAIPGYVYSVDMRKKPYPPRRVWRVMETLERVHGPFWPEGPGEVKVERRRRRVRARVE